MPKDLGKMPDQLNRRYFNLTNRVGGMGRYGVKGNVESLEEKRRNRERYLRRKRRIPGVKGYQGVE